MANYTTDDLAAVQAAIASGELSIQKGERKVQYRSMAELVQAEALIRSELASQTTGKRGGVRRFTFTTARGD